MLFEAIYGLKVNFHKSLLVGVNVADSWMHETSLVMKCKKVCLPFLYPGLPIGEDSQKLNFWTLLMDRIKSRLSGWMSNNLSLGGRLVLLKHVLSSTSVYFLFFYKTPSRIISSLESI